MIEKIIIISFIVFGIYATMQPGMIFEKLGDWIANVFGEWWSKPIAMCPVCMGFWWGSVIYWAVPLWSHNWIEWLCIAVSLIGLNYILIRLFPED